MTFVVESYCMVKCSTALTLTVQVVPICLLPLVDEVLVQSRSTTRERSGGFSSFDSWRLCSMELMLEDFFESGFPFLSKLFTERRAWYCSGMTTNVVTIHEYRLDICWLLQYYICHDSFWMRYITSPYWWTRTETVTAAAGIHQVLVSWIALPPPDNDQPPPTGSDAVRSGPPFLGRYRMAPFSFKTKYHISWFFWFGGSDLKWLDRMTLFW